MTNSTNQRDHTFHAFAEALYLMDLKLRYKCPSSGKIVTNEFSRDEIAVYSKMQARFEFFRGQGNEHFDSYAGIGRLLKISESGVKKIVPRLRKAGLLNYKTVRLANGQLSNIYTYFIKPMDLVQRYDGALIDAVGEEPVVTYRNGTNQPPKDIPQVLRNDTVYCKAHGLPVTSVPAHKAIKDTPQPVVEDEHQEVPRPSPELSIVQHAPVSELEEIVKSEPSTSSNDRLVIGLERDFKKLDTPLDFGFDPESSLYVLSQNGHCIESFPNTGKARTCLNYLRAEQTNNTNNIVEDNGW